MIEKATNCDLVTGLKGHLEETNKQVERLEKAFEKLGKEPSGTKCPAIDGIIGGRRNSRRDRGQGRPGRGHRLERAGRRALRNLPLRNLDRLGQRTGPG
jgi:hypothetical protein